MQTLCWCRRCVKREFEPYYPLNSDCGDWSYRVFHYPAIEALTNTKWDANRIRWQCVLNHCVNFGQRLTQKIMNTEKCLATVAAERLFLIPVGNGRAAARFEPPAGKRLLIIGQDLGASFTHPVPGSRDVSGREESRNRPDGCHFSAPDPRPRRAPVLANQRGAAVPENTIRPSPRHN